MNLYAYEMNSHEVHCVCVSMMQNTYFQISTSYYSFPKLFCFFFFLGGEWYYARHEVHCMRFTNNNK